MGMRDLLLGSIAVHEQCTPETSLKFPMAKIVSFEARLAARCALVLCHNNRSGLETWPCCQQRWRQSDLEIAPYDDGRPAIFTFVLPRSVITPRSIAFISMRSKDGR